jgi:hypothetical protein
MPILIFSPVANFGQVSSSYFFLVKYGTCSSEKCNDDSIYELMDNCPGETCAVGADCPTNQVCDPSKTCALCAEGSQPNEAKSKCEGTYKHMFYCLFFNKHQR